MNERPDWIDEDDLDRLAVLLEEDDRDVVSVDDVTRRLGN